MICYCETSFEEHSSQERSQCKKATTAQPLSGLRVIDLTHGISGPVLHQAAWRTSARTLSRWRSPAQATTLAPSAPFPRTSPITEKSGIFLFLNTNKRSVTLDLKTSEGVEALKKMARDADVLVESYKPGVMDDLGLGYDTLREINPDLIYTSRSPTSGRPARTRTTLHRS